MMSWEESNNTTFDTHENDGSSASDEAVPPCSMSVVYSLIECRDWEGVTNFFEAVPQAAKMGDRMTMAMTAAPHHHSNTLLRKGCTQENLPLHEVCRHQPPIELVTLLLELHEDAVRLPGRYGYLPLHFACSTGASVEVVARLMEVHPAATRCRDEIDDALPLHLAARWGASEDVLMEILTAHPEGSFMRDASGKSPLDHARSLPATSEIRSYAVNALETAPIFVATAKAAAARMTQEYETRIQGMQEAHAEYVRQLEDRQEEEKTCFMQLELQFQN